MASTGSSSTAGTEPTAPAVADIVVGIAGWNNADTVGTVVDAVAAGLGGYRLPTCIVLADGGSSDGTRDRAREALSDRCFVVATTDYVPPTTDPLRLPYHGLPGRAEAIRVVLRTAVERSARAVAFVDAGLTTVTPDWIPRLIDPVLDDARDYVSARYTRQPQEGALTRSVIYPLFRSLYGVQVHQPAAGEFAASALFAQHALDQPIWEGDEAQTAIDLWLVAEAAAAKMRIGEAMLGLRRYRSTLEAPDLSATVRQVVGALFADLTARTQTWQRVRGSVAVPMYGQGSVAPPVGVAVDIDRMIDAYRLGYSALRELWAWVVEPRIVLQLKRLADAPVDRFRLPDEAWVQIVYDFALAYGLRSMSREHLLGAFTPLYLGWLAAFLLEVGTADAEAADARIETLCLAFEARKSYLIAGWRWPEQFRA